MSRCLALTIPAVTEFSSPNGEPIAITHSPTLRRLESPILTAGKPLASILTTATSVRLSAPTMRALNSRLSVRVTITSSAPSTTCALVMMKPSAVRMKPEPTPRGCSSSWGRLGRGPWRGTLGRGTPKKRRKNSCMSSSPAPPCGLPPRFFSRVRMFTTEGPTCSTSSVKSGKPRTAPGPWAQAGTVGAKVATDATKKAPASACMRSVLKFSIVFLSTSIFHHHPEGLETNWGFTGVAQGLGQRPGACASAPRPPR